MKYSTIFKSMLAVLCLSLFVVFSSCEKPALEELSDSRTVAVSINDQPEEARDVRITDRNSPRTVDVYLIIGQSNCIGGGKPTTTNGNNHNLLNSFSPILFAARQSSRYWGSKASVLPWGALRIRTYDQNQFGSEMAFGRRLYNNTQAYRNNTKKLAIIKCGVGGSTLLPSSKNHSWDGTLSNRTIAYVNDRINQLKNMGYTTINVKGMVWIQGESDLLQHRNLLYQYPGKLNTMLNKMRYSIQGAQNMTVALVGLNRDAGAYALKIPNTNTTYLPFVNSFNNKLWSLANSNPRYRYVSANGLDMRTNTDIHYNGNGLIGLGFRTSTVYY